jgi:hypothetical protein
LFRRELVFPVPYLEMASFFRRVADHLGKLLVGFIYITILIEDDNAVSGLLYKNTAADDFIG